MSKITAKCATCKESFETRLADIRRGWGKHCSKSCAKSASNLRPKRPINRNIYEQALGVFGVECLSEIETEEDVINFWNLTKLLK